MYNCDHWTITGGGTPCHDIPLEVPEIPRLDGTGKWLEKQDFAQTLYDKSIFSIIDLVRTFN